jgi:hypothetical protein
MTIEEYLSIFTDLGLINQSFTERDVLVSYNQAMITQVDEISSIRHMKMQFLEFLEAISRCADLLSLSSSEQNEGENPPEKRVEQPLVSKLEQLLYILIKLGKKEFITKYKWPTRGLWNLFAVSKSIFVI